MITVSFRDLDIQMEYRSLVNDVAKNFYIPVLKEAVLYQRAVGFFSSSILSEISTGIEELAYQGGKIQLIASPRLQEKDVEAIRKGYEMKNNESVREAVQEALFRELLDPSTPEEERRLDLLANLIAADCLDIKIAMVKAQNTIAMYHEKIGIMKDTEGNRIAFTGSLNETSNSLLSNYESIDVYRSWENSFEEERARVKEAAFLKIWNNQEEKMEVLTFPAVKEELIKRYRVSKSFSKKDEPAEEIIPTEEMILPQVITKKGPHIPEDVHMRDYQNEAYENWEKQGYRGIFDMATGTGKTYTALAAICRMYEKIRNLAVIIVCPYQHLVEQWKSDIEAFGMAPIVCYSASAEKQWWKHLQNEANAFKVKVNPHFCMVTTNATYSTERVQKLLKTLKGNTLLVIDEAHNFGSLNLQNTLLSNMKYRLALSATIERYGDEDGTQAHYDYFGKKCIEYTLKDAIDNGMLTPYRYYPIVVSLTDDEREEYINLTREIGKYIASSAKKRGKKQISEAAKRLLIKRARLVAAASEKITALREEIAKYRDSNHMLVYCGATTMRDAGYEEGNPPTEEMKQINVVTDLLGNQMGFRVAQFTSKEDSQKRKELIRSFDEGIAIQALIAIRCLDEGVNVPSVDKAFILSSSTNPKEYIQRRGRVLRLYPGKDCAEIYDFITLPVALDDVGSYAEDDIASMRALARREVERMIDFGRIAKNPFDIDSLEFEIKDVYGLKDERNKEGEFNEWD